MFRWCAYCQHFLGEAPPLDQYMVSHGICAACEASLDPRTLKPTESSLFAQKIFMSLFGAGRARRFDLAEELIQKAIDLNVRPSELFLGILQPSLYEIGARWEKGLITPAEEHAFSAWCEEVITRFSKRPPESAPARVLLTPVRGNTHFLGISFLRFYLEEHGISCRVLSSGLPDDELLEHCLREQPEFCGLSVSLPEGITRARLLARRLMDEPRIRSRVFLGGYAFRTGATDVTGDVPTFTTVEDLMAFIGKPR